MTVLKNEMAVLSQYQLLAPSYDRRWHNYINKSLSFLVNFADIQPQTSILDLACGTGELAKLLLAQNPQQAMTGVDIYSAMLKIANSKLQAYPHVNLYNASVTALPFEEESFDLVICANAFHYFVSPQLALIEIKRVLKIGGEVIILDWCGDYILLKMCDLFFKLIDPAYQKCYSQRDLNQLLIDTGFVPVKDRKIRFGVMWELMAVIASSRVS